MQCEQYHRDVKNRLNLLDLNAYNEDFLNRYLIVVIFKGYLKYVVSEEKELSLLGLGLFILKSFILSFKEGSQNDY